MKVTHWSDYICPYCYISEKRLKSAIEELGLENDVEIEVKSFELDPNASREVELSMDKRFSKNFGLSLEEARNQIEHISETGRAESINLNFANVQYTNMLDAHRLAKFVASKGNKENAAKIVELLFDAYFSKNFKLTDRKVLLDLARQVRLDVSEVNTMLDSNDFISEVRKDEEEGRELGITSLPFFMIDDQYSISGIKSKDEIKSILLQILRKQTPEFKTAEGLSCGLKGCCN